MIVFEDPVWGGLVSHRLESVNEDGSLITHGDANRGADSTPVTREQVVGIGRILVPGIGWPTVWAAAGDVRSLTLAVVGWLLVLFAAPWGILRRFDPWLDGVATPPRRVLRRRTPGRHRAPRPSHTRTAYTTLAGIIAVLLIASTGVASGAFTGTSSDAGNSLEADTDFSYTALVQADSPSLWWRLGDAPVGGGPGSFTDDFESFSGWVTYGSGTVSQSNAQARGGTWSGHKDTASDPNGAWKPLGFTTGDDWSVEAWIHRPSVYPGGRADRISVENGSFNGYGVMINHSNDTLQIERRTGGSGSTLSGGSTPLVAPVDAWYRVVLDCAGGSFTATVYDAGGAPLATVAATDATYTGLDRFVVRGGYDYYVDDVTVTTPNGPGAIVAADTMGVLDGTYVGSPTLGQPSLVDGETDTSVTFNGTNGVAIGDHNLLNTSTRTQRSVELWFNATGVSGRQVIYEEGGSTNGMVIYLDGPTFRARAWSASTGWSNELDTSAPISAGQIYHVVVTLNTASNPNLILYLDGTSVDSASKADGNAWSTHSDDGAIAGQNGSTRYHDGTTGSSGTNLFTGTIDDVAIYNTILSPSRVQAHWIAGTP